MPVSTISQVISTIPEAGHRGVDVQTTFVNKQEDFQDHLQGTTVAELNTLKTQINTTVAGINTAVDTTNANVTTSTNQANTATTQAGIATTQAGTATTQAGIATTQASKADTWANASFNTEVETGKYSAKHWSQVAQNATDLKVDKTSDTGSAKIPAGTTAQRDASPIDGMIRYNSTLKGFEGYFNGQWQSVGGGQMFGNAVTKAVSYNAQVISENIDVPAGVNAYSVGDVTIANGYSLTIADGSIYKIL